VLGDEHRMTAERRLLAVVARRRGREALGDEVARVVEDRGASLGGQILPLPGAERKAAPERRTRQRGKDVVEIAHERE